MEFVLHLVWPWTLLVLFLPALCVSVLAYLYLLSMGGANHRASQIHTLFADLRAASLFEILTSSLQMSDVHLSFPGL